MQDPLKPGFLPSDTHHDVLSNQPKQAHEGLMDHLQSALPNPLELLLGSQAQVAGAMLDHVVLQPQPLLAADDAPAATHTLPQACRLSESMIWRIMTDYYSSQGIAAWQHNVPNFITSSTYIAEAYADMVLAFLEGYIDQLNVDEPLYIVELAAGSGRFSYLLLRELERKLACFSRFQSLKLRYIMTDFAASNAEFWMGHDKLGQYVKKGMLDYGVYNPLVSSRIELMNSKDVLASDTLKNPLIAIANYFFDSVPMDMFRVESKVLKEGLISVEYPTKGMAPDALPHISQVNVDFYYKELYNTHYYPDAKLNALLNYYRHEIKDGTILFPVGAFDSLRNLQAMSNNRLVLLSSDKGYTTAAEMIRFYQHDFAVHDGAFSYMVNYDAIGRYFTNGGGAYFCTDAKSLSVQTVCCIEIDQPAKGFERMQYLFQEKFNRANTINSLCALLPGQEQESDAARMNYLLGLMRLHQAEPQLLSAVAEQLVVVVPNCWVTQQEDLLVLMQQTLHDFYYYPGECNLPFWMSQVYVAMNKHSESLACLDLAQHYFGEHPALFCLKGQRYESMEQWQMAKTQYQNALALQPDSQEVQEALSALENRMKSAR